MLAAAAVAVLGLQAPVSMTRVTQSRVRMAASEEPWNADCFSSTLVDKTKLECAALRRAPAHPLVPPCTCTPPEAAHWTPDVMGILLWCPTAGEPPATPRSTPSQLPAPGQRASAWCQRTASAPGACQIWRSACFGAGLRSRWR